MCVSFGGSFYGRSFALSFQIMLFLCQSIIELTKVKSKRVRAVYHIILLEKVYMFGGGSGN